MFKKFVLVFVVLLVAALVYFSIKKDDDIIKVGVLHSLSGTMAISEKSVLDATLMAIDEINKNGGVMGKKLVPIVADGESDPVIFAKKAEELITKNKVSAIFGCWTSASRKEVKNVVEKHEHLLFYPIQYEGIEESDSIVYLGQLPNQQIKPAIFFAKEKFGDDFYLVGSSYIYPIVANAYAKDIIKLLGAQILGERYVKLGESDFKDIVNDIKLKKPKVILNTINGDSNTYFFKQLHGSGISSKDIPVISFSLTENEIKQMCTQCTKESLAGHYASWSYFDTENSKENKEFKSKLGNIHPTDPMASAYSGVWLYKQAVESAKTFDPFFVKKWLPLQSYKDTGSLITLTSGNLNSWKYSKIAKLNDNLEFIVIEQSSSPIRPENYPKTRTKDEWDSLLKTIYTDFNQSWAAR